MRQSEFKKRYDAKMGRYVKKHIYGKGVVSDVCKTIGRKLFGKTMKEAAKTATKKSSSESCYQNWRVCRRKSRR